MDLHDITNQEKGAGKKYQTCLAGQRSTAPGQANNSESSLAKLAGQLHSQHWAVLFLIAGVLLIAVGLLDTWTGSEISFSIFYLLPVAFTGGFISRNAGAFMGAVAAMLWGYLEITAGRPYSAAWIPYWNSLVRLGFFLLVNELINVARRAHIKVRDMSRIDALTEIANSRVFEEHVMRSIAEIRRFGRPFTIAYVDLDKFKQVNDTFGHAEGDRLLRLISALIEKTIRTTDLVARLGGDEFGILMPETGSDQARVTLERVAATISAQLRERWGAGATFGAVTFVEAPDDFNAAVQKADALMYRGKSEGRGCILQSVWPDPDGSDHS